MLIFIDESGDLGFDFSKRGTSSHFVITALVLPSHECRPGFENGVARTLKNKINVGKAKKNPTLELKGHKTSIDVKRYLWRQIESCDFSLFSISLCKRDLPPVVNQNSHQLYNYLARMLVERIPIDGELSSVHVEIDRSKNSKERIVFNEYLGTHIEARIDPRVRPTIRHVQSQTSKGVQAADMFGWGIARKYSADDAEWYDVFKGRITEEVSNPLESGANKKTPQAASFCEAPQPAMTPRLSQPMDGNTKGTG